ncbi:MAG: hypothetical protein JRH20_28190, partial [Deltaproteobacteria bacterium]|nr:hypothetical protein [Deltaproteobacteria bacterium]
VPGKMFFTKVRVAKRSDGKRQLFMVTSWGNVAYTAVQKSSNWIDDYETPRYFDMLGIKDLDVLVNASGNLQVYTLHRDGTMRQRIQSGSGWSRWDDFYDRFDDSGGPSPRDFVSLTASTWLRPGAPDTPVIFAVDDAGNIYFSEYVEGWFCKPFCTEQKRWSGWRILGSD